MKKAVFLLIAVIFLPFLVNAADIEFYVSSKGNDSWSGKTLEPNADGTDGPFASIARAQRAIRDLRASGEIDDNAPKPTVFIRGGTYFLAEPLVFTASDSGTIYRAWRNERPVISGGVKFDEWDVTADGWWKAELPKVKRGDWSFTQLFVDDQRRLRPRLPEEGYFKIAGSMEPSADAKGGGDDRFKFGGNDIQGDWYDLHNVEVLAFHSWSMSRLPIKSVDTEVDVVTFYGTSPSSSWWGKFNEGHRYLVENVREALNSPGEWYLDRVEGTLTYIPMPGETPESSRVIAPRLERLLIIKGEPEGERVQDVLFKGLTFAHSAWRTPKTGQAIPQAEINLDGAVSATYAEGVVFRQCAVRQVGTYAVALGEGCRDNLIEACELVDLGAGGVKLGATGLTGWGGLNKMASAPEPLVSRNTVRDCTIAHGGRLHPAAIGVWIGHSPYNTIEHNDIHDFYYSATSIGWTWGYAKSHAHHNKVTFNHLYNLGQRVLSDMGAVYTLGVSPGTTVSYNVIHDVYAFDYGGWGLYTDEGSTSVTMENNLVYRTKTGGFHQHYGRENRIINNIFAFTLTDQLQRTRVEDHISFTFERNIVVYDQGQLMGKQWSDDKLIMDNNLYWNTAGKVVFPGERNLEEWTNATGHDRHSVVADPLFTEAKGGDFTLNKESPAYEIGFVPFDYNKAGRVSERSLTQDMPPVPAAFE
ncbi:MAG: right-handed parallel beta-helix repeat-containing protein [Verrucomicrobia bacterium]|nr:right-handed parallel beta-helix repeat-containing protein [Verrucomicrobiota bacterium]MCF7708419.1 right-handed parallel beta-helix repeat-containing protein [Verrucomicrobiota bacterium]